MNPPSRKRPSANVSGKVTRFVALVEEVGTGSIADDDRSKEWEVLSVSLRAGGAQPDQARLFRRLDKAGRMRNRTVSELRPQRVEIWTESLDTGKKLRPVFWGEMDARSMSLMPGGEMESAIASVRPYHFGTPLRGMEVYDADGEDTLIVEFDAEFQPLLDGRIIDNMMRKQSATGFPDYNLWFLPESSRTTTAYEQHGDLVSPFPWTLDAAVKTLCGMLNGDEDLIRNYEPDDAGDLADSPDFRNIRLRRGLYLPQLLDALLTPCGYGWRLAHATEEPEEEGGEERVKPRIMVYQRGKGPQKKLYFPALGQTATLEHSAHKVDLVADLYQLANQVRCEGALVERQVLLPLYRAWPESDDDEGITGLTKSSESATAAAFGPVWRQWVANEAGDYTGTRESVDPIGDPPDLDDVFGDGNWVIRRRQALPLLAFTDDSETRAQPPRVEWSDDSGATWSAIKTEWGCRILQDEIGVIFTADSPPAEIVEAGDEARLRIHCTIQGDKRIVATSDRQSDNPQSSTIEMVLDVSDQFHDRAMATGDFASSITGTNTVDDSTALQDFADSIREQREAVILQASIELFGIHLDYEIGDIITELTGRDIRFNRLPATDGSTEEGRFLQIVGIDYNCASGQQTTRLVVQPYDR